MCRPTKYKKKYCKEIITMAETGKLPITWAEKFDVARSTLPLWAEKHPEFMLAWSVAKEKAENYWHDQLTEATDTFELNKMKTILNLAFHVSETQKIEQKSEVNMKTTVELSFGDRD